MKFTFISKQSHIHSKKGFTLVEAMVAISILALAITGPMLIAQKGIGSAVYAKDQITAFYLAQEAVEYIRNVRDTNRIKGNLWLDGLDECLETGSGERCTIDARFTIHTNPSAIVPCPGGACPVISFYNNDSTGEGFYGYDSSSGWAPTAFKRTVSIDNRASGKEALISVNISWNTNLFAPMRSFNVKEYIFNY
jgi:prepilin-type N-terminal cleavage/methylation domain-containing protein